MSPHDRAQGNGLQYPATGKIKPTVTNLAHRNGGLGKGGGAAAMATPPRWDQIRQDPARLSAFRFISGADGPVGNAVLSGTGLPGQPRPIRPLSR